MAVSYTSGSMKLFQFVFFSPAPFRGSMCDYGKYNKFHNYFVLSSILQIKALDGINPLHQLALKLPPSQYCMYCQISRALTQQQGR